MDIVNEILNITVPLLSLITFVSFYPSLLLLRLLLYFINSFFTEDVAGKVVLITGASSGIGEHVAYEYAKRGACLAIVARRLHLLEEVAETARYLGSPDVLVVPADVTNVEDCQRSIHQTVNHFVGHLVNNAGIATMSMFEEFTHVTNAASVMETNFWGSVYTTHFAIPHLRKSRGKIIINASVAASLPVPRLAFYSASKAALIMFFETLRIELGGDVGITIVSPGVTESELTKGKLLSKEGTLVLDQNIRDVRVSTAPVLPMLPVEKCAKAIVDSACRGDRSLTIPFWMKVIFLWNIIFPQAIEWCNCMLFITRPETPPT